MYLCDKSSMKMLTKNCINYYSFSNVIVFTGLIDVEI